MSKILPVAAIFSLATLSASAQRCKVSYYSRVSFEVVEAYVSDAVDVQPEYPGGENAMMKFIRKERRYPKDAYEAGIQGRVVCGFIVHPSGAISDVEVVRGVEESIDREAVRIIRQMPAWKAGKINGTPVPVYCILPIAFRR